MNKKCFININNYKHIETKISKIIGLTDSLFNEYYLEIIGDGLVIYAKTYMDEKEAIRNKELIDKMLEKEMRVLYGQSEE